MLTNLPIVLSKDYWSQWPTQALLDIFINADSFNTSQYFLQGSKERRTNTILVILWLGMHKGEISLWPSK